MVFSSITFLFFFLPLFLLCYFFVKSQRQRNVILAGFSLFFYAWGEPRYLPLVLLSIGLNWYLAMRVGESHVHEQKRRWLILSIVINIGILSLFKYTPWIVTVLTQRFSLSIPYGDFLQRVPLPIGISFYTFQALSYVIDVYRGRFPYEKDLLDMGTYISMFPQLVAGPIVRYEQIKQELHFRFVQSHDIAKGACIVIIGLAFKVLLADTFSLGSDFAFSRDPTRLSVGLAWLGALSYFFQIYFDFHGYSLIAIGLGRIIGFTFPDNFDRPYISRSITEFWRRWHITLSSWFRDYLYIPLGGNRYGSLITYRNLLVVFILCGLWHGAGGHFLAWGLYHGAFLVLERIFRNRAVPVPGIVAHLYTILVILCGWILFRSVSLVQTWHYFGAMLSLNSDVAYLAREILSPIYLVFLVLGIYLSQYKVDLDTPPFLRLGKGSWLIYLSLFFACAGYLVVGTHSPFIYFQF